MSSKHQTVWIKALLFGIALTIVLLLLIQHLRPNPTRQTTEREAQSQSATQNAETYMVDSVVDGDTFKIIYDGKETSVRLIGVNTPETVDPRTTVECFGNEASTFLKNLLTSKEVRIEADPTQADRDRYDRLLRYVYLDDEDVGYKIISGGYGYEYTYNLPYQKQAQYKEAQTQAETLSLGLWASEACNGKSTSCDIKGNINVDGEKIYHIPGQEYYSSTEINVDMGERWFCSEEEAQAAGWRRSKV